MKKAKEKMKERREEAEFGELEGGKQGRRKKMQTREGNRKE